ncbi:hypothetical protein AYO20_02455 [Fonsecaea nubica]|uniref:Enoyl-CoA hydratase n=1 Tax=Fonsecaea nubica TaxID=856822 RepID=A0A178D9H1_9EURO|nr:hypothetical protein AYO20_02455 [Fonsecaea nubica]OAL38396.1 hypothetical protein AYO20_02455 [Fonsecaea nubica]
MTTKSAFTGQSRPHPASDGYIVSFPAQHVMLVTINRPAQMNSITYQLHWDMDSLINWFEDEPELRVAIVTGAGKKSFCAGSDLIEMLKVDDAAGSKSAHEEHEGHKHPLSGFAGISRRSGRKPIIAAVNGYALGGGWEIALNCDVVVASPTATFGLPEPKVGQYAYSGGLPRLVRSAGLHIASYIALSGRSITAQEALGYGLVNRVSQSGDSLIAEAVEVAGEIAALSPDAIIVTRAALREAWKTADVEVAFQDIHRTLYPKLKQGENFREGLAAFRDKRAPSWKPSKL